MQDVVIIASDIFSNKLNKVFNYEKRSKQRFMKQITIVKKWSEFLELSVMFYNIHIIYR